MSKPSGHRGWKRQPAVNIPTPGTTMHVYSWLFPQEWRTLNETLLAFDTAWLRSHPGERGFCRRYVPGEAYPKHDPAYRYVSVIRYGAALRARAMIPARSHLLPFVDLPPELAERCEPEN